MRSFKFSNLKSKAIPFLTLLSVFLIMVLVTNGDFGNPSAGDLNGDRKWFDTVFENSSPKSRFALIYSIVEDRSLFLSENLALFSSPDVSVNDGRYVSIFAPGTSFVYIPSYLVGRFFGSSQLFVFATTSAFAILNFLLVVKISQKLGGSKYASFLGGLVFLFASPSFSYSVTLYQHHLTVFLLLLSLYLAFNYNNLASSFLVSFLCSFSILVDYPNLFIFFPVGLYTLAKTFHFERLQDRVNIRIKPFSLLMVFSALLPLYIFFWYNKEVTGSLFKLSGTLDRVEGLGSDPVVSLVTDIDKGAARKSAIGFFDTRDLLNGFYVHFLSPDRGIVTFAPVVFFGFIGFAFFYRKGLYSQSSVLVSTSVFVVLVYSLWGDPWGGWAFGSRYLIPLYAILGIASSILLSNISKRFLFFPLFAAVFIRSAYVNSLGVVSPITNPPQSEVLALEKVTGREEKYTYARNVDHIKSGNLKPLIYRSFASRYVDGWKYFYIVFGIVTTLFAINSFGFLLSRRDK